MRRWWWLIAIAIGAVIFALGLDRWVVTVAEVTSDSMAPTIEPGQTVAISPLPAIAVGSIVAVDPRGSFVALNHPDITMIKRVVGVAGDRVQCCVDGQLLRNGIPVAEPYLATDAGNVEFDVIVPPGKVWLLGDNQDHSADSRAFLGLPGGGFVPEHRLKGTVVFRLWPPGRIDQTGKM